MSYFHARLKSPLLNICYPGRYLQTIVKSPRNLFVKPTGLSSLNLSLGGMSSNPLIILMTLLWKLFRLWAPEPGQFFIGGSAVLNTEGKEHSFSTWDSPSVSQDYNNFFPHSVTLGAHVQLITHYVSNSFSESLLSKSPSLHYINLIYIFCSFTSSCFKIFTVCKVVEFYQPIQIALHKWPVLFLFIIPPVFVSSKVSSFIFLSLHIWKCDCQWKYFLCVWWNWHLLTLTNKNLILPSLIMI